MRGRSSPPESFARTVATYPPYNEHLFHDIGAFQLGIGAALIAGFVVPDALSAALWGAAVGSVFHFIAHVLDRDLGGRSTDPYLLGVFAAIVLAAALIPRTPQPRTPAGEAPTP